MTRYTVHFTGMVQGVGFRATTHHVARNFAVAGYVQNLSDGRVRLVAEGPAQELQAFVEAVRQQMGRYIDEHQIDQSEGTGEFGDPNQRGSFGVRY